MNSRILSPDFIPHSRFHHASWYQEKDGPVWYWNGIPRISHVIPKSQKFYDTLDPELSGVVKGLHQAGIPTTPSCAGHIADPGFYSKTWDELKDQEKRVRGRGVILEDPETGHQTPYRYQNFTLPWSKDEFIGRGVQHQKKGCLGVVPPSRFVQAFDIKIPGFETRRDNNTIVYLTESRSKEEISEKWNLLESYLGRIYKWF